MPCDAWALFIAHRETLLAIGKLSPTASTAELKMHGVLITGGGIGRDLRETVRRDYPV
jgi:hypothetical protein